MLASHCQHWINWHTPRFPPVVLAFRFFFPLKIYLVVRQAAVVNNVEKAAALRGKHHPPSGRFAPCAPSLRAGLNNGWPPAMLLKRGTPRSRCATVAAHSGTSAAHRPMDIKKPTARTRRHLPAGLRPESEEQSAASRAAQIDRQGKALSKRPCGLKGCKKPFSKKKGQGTPRFAPCSSRSGSPRPF